MPSIGGSGATTENPPGPPASASTAKGVAVLESQNTRLKRLLTSNNRRPAAFPEERQNHCRQLPEMLSQSQLPVVGVLVCASCCRADFAGFGSKRGSIGTFGTLFALAFYLGPASAGQQKAPKEAKAAGRG